MEYKNRIWQIQFKSKQASVRRLHTTFPEIANQMVKISCTAKIGDKSDICKIAKIQIVSQQCMTSNHAEIQKIK